MTRKLALETMFALMIAFAAFIASVDIKMTYEQNAPDRSANNEVKHRVLEYDYGYRKRFDLEQPWNQSACPAGKICAKSM
jgi:hypothetical protein